MEQKKWILTFCYFISKQKYCHNSPLNFEITVIITSRILYKTMIEHFQSGCMHNQTSVNCVLLSLSRSSYFCIFLLILLIWSRLLSLNYLNPWIKDYNFLKSYLITTCRIIGSTLSLGYWASFFINIFVLPP